MTSIEQSRICASSEFLPEHAPQLQYIKSVQNSGNKLQAKALHAAFVTSKIWPEGSKLRIGFFPPVGQVKRTPQALLQGTDKNGNPIQADAIQAEIDNMSPIDAVKHIVTQKIIPLCNKLDIQFVDNVNQANIKVAFDGDKGAWSLIGTDHISGNSGYPQTVNFGWIDANTIMHEFLHVLSLIHEHQNPRGESIPWNKDIVYEWAKRTQGWDKPETDHNIFDRYELNTTNGSEYDPNSIMLYFFPNNFTTNGKGTKENLQMSDLDIEWIKRMYYKEGGSPLNPPPKVNPPVNPPVKPTVVNPPVNPPAEKGMPISVIIAMIVLVITVIMLIMYLRR